MEPAWKHLDGAADPSKAAPASVAEPAICMTPPGLTAQPIVADGPAPHTPEPVIASPAAAAETGSGPPGGALHCLRDLRRSLSGRTGGVDSRLAAHVDSQLGRVDSALELVLREHEGMANELLRVYEQVGIVFEVTRRLAEVHSEAEVVRLFIDSLQRTYSHVRCGTMAAPMAGSATDEHTVQSGPLQHKAWVEAAVRKARAQRSVVVENRPPEPAAPNDGPAMSNACDAGRPAGDPNASLSALGTAVQVLVGPVFAGDEFVCTIVMANDRPERSFDSSDMLLLDALAVFCGDLIRSFRLLRELRQLSVDMVRALVGAVDQKDPYTSGHSNRVGCYARALGEDLGLDNESLQMLEWSALLHDVGKIGIRDEVLKKPGRLSDEEFAHIKEHPVRSFHVVRGIPQLAAALDGVLYHHEHYDGSGYPDGLAGEQIPLQARIIQIADVFDALTTSRSYRKAFEWERALKIINEEAGTTVDPELARRFDRLVRSRIAADPDALAKLCGPWWAAADPKGTDPAGSGQASGDSGQGSGFRIQGSEVQGSGFRVQGSGTAGATLRVGSSSGGGTDPGRAVSGAPLPEP